MKAGPNFSSRREGSVLAELFLSFLKIGAFTFGGGYAMIALLESELVVHKKWLSHEEFLDMAAIAESTPGPIAINSATYLGYKIGGLAGAVLATVAVVLPSFSIIYIISLFFEQFLGLVIVGRAFKGIQIGVLLLIFSAGVRMLKELERNPFNICVLAAVCAASIALSVLDIDISSVLYIALCGAAGVAVYLLRRGKGGE